MLPQHSRLKSQALFKQALGGRRLFACGAFVMYGVLRRPGALQPTRIGFIISKKTEKRAVRRNRIKRRLREIFRRQLLADPPERLARYTAIVMIIRPAALDLAFGALAHWVLKAFSVGGDACHGRVLPAHRAIPEPPEMRLPGPTPE